GVDAGVRHLIDLFFVVCVVVYVPHAVLAAEVGVGRTEAVGDELGKGQALGVIGASRRNGVTLKARIAGVIPRIAVDGNEQLCPASHRVGRPLAGLFIL